MNTLEFNEKWKDYLEEGFYGLVIDHPEVIKYLDKEFEEETRINKEFSYSQIKLKFGFSRVYADTDKWSEWEDRIDKILDHG